MGWSYTQGNGSHRDMDREYEGDGWGYKVIACSLVNYSHHWSVIEDKVKGDRFILLDLIDRVPHKGEWGWKSMDEGMHPCYYDCPLKFLALVPQVGNEEWRNYVRMYWAKIADRIAYSKARKVKVLAIA